MAKKDHVSETPATQMLKANKVAFTEHPYEYLEHGGAQHSAQVLGLDPFTVVKTLVMQDQDAKPLLVLMHGNLGMLCLTPAMRVRVQNGMICSPTPRSVCPGTRKGFGEESARFGPNPFGGVGLRAIRFVAKSGKASALPWVLRLTAHPAKPTPRAAGVRHSIPEVSTKNLARQIGAKSVEPCQPEVANRHSGYLVGGTSPFGTRKAMPVYIEESILALPKIAINGGRRGYLVGIAPQVCVDLLGAKSVHCALAD